MEIKSVDISNQLRMIRGVDSIFPKGDGEIRVGEAPKGEKVSFAEFLEKQFKSANDLGVEADRKMQQAIVGGDINPHDTLIAIEKASVSLSLLMGVKQRLERVYQELIRTPIG